MVKIIFIHEIIVGIIVREEIFSKYYFFRPVNVDGTWTRYSPLKFSSSNFAPLNCSNLLRRSATLIETTRRGRDEKCRLIGARQRQTFLI